MKRFTSKFAFALVVCLGLAVPFKISAAEDADYVPLFDGKTLQGWKASENPKSVRVEEGTIVCDGPRAHLFYMGTDSRATFKNFEALIEVKTTTGANSGFYFHTEYQDSGFPGKGFEAQVHNTQREENGYRENKLTGSLYGIRNVYKPMARDGEWFSMRLSVRDKHVRIWVNEVLLVDYFEPQNPPRIEGRTGRRLDQGTFAIQCHDPKSKVHYRKILVKRLPDDIQDRNGSVVQFNAYESELVRLGVENYPVLNSHVHLKGGLTLEEALAESRKSGVFYGIAVNCGVGFSVTNDAGIQEYLDSMKGQPVFVGMQAEGREWVKMFSSPAIAKFDYVFTDSMTFSDRNGRRMRLWINEEVGRIEDKQAFMELLVERAVGILGSESINIYVNPTFLPDQLAAEYNQLWTEERMQKLVDVAARRGIAIEINSRYKLPGISFIKMAKKAGCKFTFGTNNGAREVGSLDYCLQAVKECGLTWKDMWTPLLKTSMTSN